jgi:hypothetical protein
VLGGWVFDFADNYQFCFKKKNSEPDNYQFLFKEKGKVRIIELPVLIISKT